jgi:hypothetical protein
VSAALAADDPIKVSMELSKTKFSGPENINVSITVTNVGDGDMPSAVTLYYPNGKKVEDFGSPKLSVGASKRWNGTWTVTKEQLEVGKISFQVRYSFYGGEPDAVVSGFHMMKRSGSYSEEDLSIVRQTARWLKKNYGGELYTCHCTGLEPFAEMKRILGERLHYVHCGETLEF